MFCLDKFNTSTHTAYPYFCLYHQSKIYFLQQCVFPQVFKIDTTRGKSIFFKIYSNEAKFYSKRLNQSISTCYPISLFQALISKTTHENIGFEKLQFINPQVPWDQCLSQDFVFSILYGSCQKLILDEKLEIS